MFLPPVGEVSRYNYTIILWYSPVRVRPRKTHFFVICALFWVFVSRFFGNSVNGMFVFPCMRW